MTVYFERNVLFKEKYSPGCLFIKWKAYWRERRIDVKNIV